MLTSATHSRRIGKLTAVARLVVAALLLKVSIAILLEYRWYFPPNFDSAFLTGREPSFAGLYAVAFYTHLISGPLTLFLGVLLLCSGARARFAVLHRWSGRLQGLLIFGALTPSGVVMATQAMAGPVAGYGFAALALATAVSTAATIFYAYKRQFVFHERWARRTLVLLVSPLVLRLVSGGLIVMQQESAVAYRLNAWLSWLIPVLLYEAWWRCQDSVFFASPASIPCHLAEEVTP